MLHGVLRERLAVGGDQRDGLSGVSNVIPGQQRLEIITKLRFEPALDARRYGGPQVPAHVSQRAHIGARHHSARARLPAGQVCVQPGNARVGVGTAYECRVEHAG